MQPLVARWSSRTLQVAMPSYKAAPTPCPSIGQEQATKRGRPRQLHLETEPRESVGHATNPLALKQQEAHKKKLREYLEDVETNLRTDNW